MKKDEFASLVIFSADEVEGLYDSRSSLLSSLSRYVKSGQLVRVRRDMYAAIDPMTKTIYANKYEIASKITFDSYVAYHSALEYHGLATQTYNVMYIASKNRVSTFEYSGIEYLRIEAPFQEGVIEKQNNSTIRVTDLERTLVDCIDRLDLAGGADELIDAIAYLHYVKESSILKYLEKYNKKFLYQKTGFFFSYFTENLVSNDFLQICKRNMGDRKTYIDGFVKGNRKLDKEWNLIVPDSYKIKW